MSVRDRSSRRPSKLTRDSRSKTRNQKPETRKNRSPSSGFCFLVSGFRSRSEIVSFQYPVEDSVDELRRFVVAELLGDLDRFVDDDELGGAALVQELVNRHPDDVAVDVGHA